jgi:exopolysaccharide biosynthesis predicted pyruvyltransferase EpsI
LLSRFKAVSVREEQGQQICKERFSCNPKVVLDPTFLNYRYDEFWEEGNKPGGLLCYKLNKNKDFWDNILSVGENLGMEVMVLNNSLPRKGFKYCPPTSLETWMQKFHDASFIVTDSFHGVAFSIINRKQFVVILNDNGLNSRLVNLMHQMDLDDRVYSSVAEMKDRTDWLNKIDYSRIEGRIKNLVEDSRKFLIDALNI